MNLIFTVFAFLLTISTTFGFRKPSTDSLVHKWKQLEAGQLVMSDSLKARLLIDIGAEMTYETPDSAIGYYNEALELSRRQGNDLQTGEILNSIGFTNYVLGNYDLALTFFVDALEIHKSLANDIGIAKSLNHISLIYETQKNFDQALKYQWRSIVHSIRSGDPNRLISNYFNLSIIHDHNYNYDSALFYLAKSLDLSLKNKNYHMYSMALNRRGEVYLHKENYRDAEESYWAVLNNENYKDRWEDCFAYAGLAKVYQQKREYDKSIEYGMRSLELARQMDSKWEIAQDAKILYQSYKAKNDYRLALQMHELYKLYNDSLFNERTEKEINFLHLKQNELERAQLIKENELSKAIIKQSYLWIAFFVVLGISLTVWGIILVKNIRQKQILNNRLLRKNESIAERNAMIEKQNIALNELNESKNQLLSIIGHDMRSPINNIKSILGIIKSGGLGEEDQRKVFEDLYKTINTVSGTLNNMLSWASSQLDGIQIQPSRVQLSAVVEELKEFFRQSAVDKQIEIIHHRNDEVYVWFDEDHLKTALRNLLSNAIKFTNRGGEISIQYHIDGGFANLSVSDTGIGIAANDIENVFKFRGRSKSIGTNNEKGTGIGLMLSKEFIESNGGTIDVSSTLGEGSVFILSLPVAEMSGKEGVAVTL
ncbi:MAG: tetratricopeptide repeat-containing sensor histidine kinase [Cyclobacteriaceae bacterium]